MTFDQIEKIWVALAGRPLRDKSLAEQFARQIEAHVFEEAAQVAEELTIVKPKRYADPDTARAIARNIRMKAADSGVEWPIPVQNANPSSGAKS